MDAHLSDSNPVAGVENFDIPATPPRVLSFEEEDRLMPKLAEADPYLLPFVTLAVGTGMREMEMLGMRKAQLDFRRALIFVCDPKWPDDPRATKGIPMSKMVADIMRAWLKETKGNLVFPSPMYPDRHLSRQSVISAFSAACEQAGIKGLTIHKLRHTFGTRLGEAGYSTQEIADLMGHSDIRMARIYVHTSRERQRSAVESVWARSESKVVEISKAN